MSRVGLLRVSESAGPPSGLAAVRRHGHHQHPFGVGVCRHHQLHSTFAPAGLISCPIGHQGSIPALRRSACPGSVALAAAPSAVNTKLQWKSRLQPHAGSELQRPSPLHMHQKTCPEPLRGPPAATRRQRRRASASPAAARASSQPLLLLTAWGVWRRLRRGWVVKVPEVECPRGARWNGGSVRSAEANQRPDRKSSGSFVRCAAIGTRQQRGLRVGGTERARKRAMAVDCDLDGSESIEMSRVDWDESTSRPVRATCAVLPGSLLRAEGARGAVLRGGDGSSGRPAVARATGRAARGHRGMRASLERAAGPGRTRGALSSSDVRRSTKRHSALRVGALVASSGARKGRWRWTVTWTDRSLLK